jgi:signal transduction histidine kinase
MGLAALQYHWTGEISRAERQRLKDGLQASLQRLSQEFNAEITSPCVALLPGNEEVAESGRDQAYLTRYSHWKDVSRHDEIIRRIAIATPAGDTLRLEIFQPEHGILVAAQWPNQWVGLRERLQARLNGNAPPGPMARDEGMLVEIPRMSAPGMPRGRMGLNLRELEWLILEFNLEYIRANILPELVPKYLGRDGQLEFDVQVVPRVNLAQVIYRAGTGESLISNADGSISLFELDYERVFRRFGMRGRGGGGRVRYGGREGQYPEEQKRVRTVSPGPPPTAPGSRLGIAGAPFLMGRGRWELMARHRAGSLETVVAQARWRNLAVSAGILALMVASVVTLVRVSRQAQRLAEAQMDFVAGVSHELRTPLTVMGTAAFNLRGKIANNPVQVERYGALIQEQCAKLTAIVEQVLRYAGANAGRVIRESSPVEVDLVLREEANAVRALSSGADLQLDVRIEPGLPPVLGDAMALKHAVQNLLNNAVKYGVGANQWIGISAGSQKGRDGRTMVEIRVADRGPGIPADEQKSIFDPFFRGKRAVADQIHGTGLGLHLVKRIVEAHGGSIEVRSEVGAGTEFILRLPALPVELQHEIAHSLG